MDIYENVRALKAELSGGNAFGEKVLLVAATKMQSAGAINEAIKADVEVVMEEMTVEEAKQAGAVGIFTNKYGDRVKVYTMGKYSKEMCGGPHAKTTGELHEFKIKKEEASSAGVRRIKAVLL